jgi:tetratricopeptide (TPR) repeat protein
MSKIDLESQRKLLDREITFFHFGRAEKKIQMCLKESVRQKDDFYRYYFLGQREVLAENFQAAMRYFDLALDLRPKDGCTYNDKALCFAETGRLDKALACFNEGIKKDADCASLYQNKGWLLHLMKRYKPAILCFNKALELDRNRPEALFSLADTYQYLDDKIKACHYFKTALKAVRGKSAFAACEIAKRLRDLSK